MQKKYTYQTLRKQTKRISLRSRLTIAIAGIVLISILGSKVIAEGLSLVFPAIRNVPDIVQINLISLLIGAVLGRFAMRVITDPIQELREGIEKVADGDYDVQLNSRTASKEIQELVAGFNMMANELRSTEMLQTSFVSNVSHEFKTPISAIEGYTTLLQGTENIDEVENEYIEKILFNTRRLSTLVSNILLLSKLETQSIQTNQEHYRLDEQIREAVVGSEFLWSPKDIDFDVDLAEVMYFGNKNLMHHVWNNLLSNAIKFSPDGGVIKIRLQQKENCIVFYIENDGPGIPESAQKRIFDKFYQEDNSHKEEGNGLGLPLAKRILTLAGGSISVRNKPDTGCRFTVMLAGSGA